MTENVQNIKRPHTTPNPGRMLPQRSNNKLAVWFFLGGEVILFTALIMTFLMFRVRYTSDYATFRSYLNLPLTGLNTLILIVSSYLVVRSLQAIGRNDRRGLIYNLIGVLLLGTLFIGGQAFEWSDLISRGITISTIFGSPFFIVTGIHGSHVLIGLVWDCFIIIFGLSGTFSSKESRGVEIFGLYWHFVDIVWVILFSVIYLL
jgi:heme/copper-type cytochrome/quinol oxidase subunit 3